MPEDHEHIESLQRRVSPTFGKDLKTLYSPKSAAPGKVDQAIVQAARQRLTKPSRHRLRLTRIGAAAAAAAVILFLITLNVTRHGGISDQPPLASIPADIDGNGRVDILDAFKLARRIEGAGDPEAAWDLNGDGRIDAADVDLVALAAVRLDGGA